MQGEPKLWNQPLAMTPEDSNTHGYTVPRPSRVAAALSAESLPGNGAMYDSGDNVYG